MSHTFADIDINEIFTGYVSWSTEWVLHVNYLAPTSSTYYTREDLLHMIDILDGKEEGVKNIMTCECQVCKDIKHLRECGVSEDFIDRWMNEGMDSNVNAAILDGSWPSAVEQLQCALENAIKLREQGY